MTVTTAHQWTRNLVFHTATQATSPNHRHVTLRSFGHRPSWNSVENAARDARAIHRGLEAMQPIRLRDRWSGLPVVIHLWRQSEPGMHRLLPDRVAGWRKGRWIKRANRDPTDGRVAISLPIQRGAATRAEMKSNAVIAVGLALVDLPLAVEPHPLFGVCRTEMESRAGAPLARLAMAKVNSIRLTRGYHLKRAAVASPVRSIGLLPGYLMRICPRTGGCRVLGSVRSRFRDASAHFMIGQDCNLTI
jgi:hypothetical protein